MGTTCLQIGFFNSVIKIAYKVQLFWESHKYLCHLLPWFWNLLSKHQNHKEDCAHFCGFLRKAELYKKKVNLHPFLSTFIKKILYFRFFVLHLQKTLGQLYHDLSFENEKNGMHSEKNNILNTFWSNKSCKVHIFWEGHKILRNLPLTFDYST